MTVDEMRENGSKHWKQQALIQVLRAEFEEWLDSESKYLIEDVEGNIINIAEKLRAAYFAASEPREEKIAALEAQIKRMSELINRYYMVCTEIPKELRTMTFDSCLEDTVKMLQDREVKK